MLIIKFKTCIAICRVKLIYIKDDFTPYVPLFQYTELLCINIWFKSFVVRDNINSLGHS